MARRVDTAGPQALATDTPAHALGATPSLTVGAAPPQALCFYHGEHEHSTLHEGSRVTSGVKRIIRSDVLYYLPGRGPPPAPPENVARVEGCPNVGNPHHMCNEYCRRMYGAPSASSSG